MKDLRGNIWKSHGGGSECCDQYLGGYSIDSGGGGIFRLDSPAFLVQNENTENCRKVALQQYYMERRL